jgi:kynurenine formamidase
MPRLVDLSHAIHDGLVTYPGISTPRIGAELTREASRARYAPGTEFHIGRIEMSTNTGTYLDTPFHRFADGFDLAALPLEAVADLPGIVVELPAGQRSFAPGDLPPAADLAGRAALLRTGWSRNFGSPRTPVRVGRGRAAPDRGACRAGGHRLAQRGRNVR